MRANSISDAEIVLRLAIVVVLCGAIGLERQARDQIAGVRTHVIVGLGAGLFTLLSAYGFRGSTPSQVDPTRIAAQVVSGIGFLGAGVILRHGVTVRGVTTAAALWVSAAIGMATCAGFYPGAVAATVIALLTLVTLRRLKPLLRRRLGTGRLSLELDLVPGTSVRTLLAELRRHGLRVEGLESQVLESGAEHLQLDLRGPAMLDVDRILSALWQMSEVARIDLAALDSLDLDAEEEESLPTERRPRVHQLLVPARRLSRRRSRRSARHRTDATPPRSESHPAEDEDRLEPMESGDDVGVHQTPDHRGAPASGLRTR